MRSSQDWKDKKLVLAAVQKKGSALKHASKTLRNDKEVVLAAVQQSASALRFASWDLHYDKEILSWASLSRGKCLWRKYREWQCLKQICDYWDQQTMKATFDAKGNAIMQGRGAKRAREEYEVSF